VTDLHYAETPAGPLAYVRQGAGEPLLLIMGVAGHHLMWSQEFLARLGERFDVVAFDHRGIGSSARAEEQFTIPDLATDAVAVLDHLGWDTAHVMGISMGGVVAQELVLKSPERVRGLVLGCTWPGPVAVGPWGDAVLDLATAASSGDAAVAARLMFEANVSTGFAAEPGRFEEFAAVAGSVKVPGPVVLMQMRAATEHNALDRLPSVDVPTLVLHGTGDRVIRSEAGEALADLIPDADLELWPEVGHLFFWEQPERAASSVTYHLLAQR
jgi:3-oxoadipate enol-lactonase